MVHVVTGVSRVHTTGGAIHSRISDLVVWSKSPFWVKLGGYSELSWDNTASVIILPAWCANMISTTFACWDLISQMRALSLIAAFFFSISSLNSLRLVWESVDVNESCCDSIISFTNESYLAFPISLMRLMFSMTSGGIMIDPSSSYSSPLSSSHGLPSTSKAPARARTLSWKIQWLANCISGRF